MSLVFLTLRFLTIPSQTEVVQSCCPHPHIQAEEGLCPLPCASGRCLVS
jgi:hypothetical protein